MLNKRLLPSGRVEFHPCSEYLGDGSFVSRISGQRHLARPGCRIVDAGYLAPEIPATTPPPFAVSEGARVIPVGELPELEEAPPEFVVVGAGKTATDACVWLLDNGVEPDAISWVRPREPWMLNRAVIQPDPAAFIGAGADIMEAAIAASSADDLFLRLEAAGVMLRIDRSRVPTMAKTPTLAQWELDLCAAIDGRSSWATSASVGGGRISSAGRRRVAILRLTVRSSCRCRLPAALPLVPIWSDEAITIQPVRAGFPCFGAALIGYAEATRDTDEDKNRVCHPSPLSDTPADWMVMQVIGGRAAQAFNAEPDIREWAGGVALNPSRIPPERAGDADVTEADQRFRATVEGGIEAMAALAGMGPGDWT
ncbi:MAG: hypothetical protein R2700_03920 [Solirubrobacterales bacterium]